MAVYGKLLLFNNSASLLCTRQSLTNLYQPLLSKRVQYSTKDNLPQKPKKPSSAFLLYVDYVRSQIVKENPNIRSSDVVKKAAQQWTELNSTEKHTYQLRYAKNHEEYLKHLAKYESSLTQEQREWIKERKIQNKKLEIEKSLKQRIENLGKPKKPLNAYLLFISERMKNKGDTSVTEGTHMELMKKFTSEWNNLAEAEKEQYRQRSKKLYDQYRENLETWTQNMYKEGHTSVLSSTALRKLERSNKKNKT